MTVTLGTQWDRFIESQLKSGRYQSASDVVCDGLRLLEKEACLARVTVSTMDELEEKLLEGLNSGPATEMTSEDWQRLREQTKSRAANGHS